MTTFAIPNEKRHLFDGKKWFDSLAQLVEHNTFNVGVLGSNPKRITQREVFGTSFFCALRYRSICSIIVFLFVAS